ncbi:PHP domain-containing protein [Desulfohalobium retbaense]|uniref:PHP domain protein n=1 Tax=Desulfohalobium retbaense (strain ATCC 49708 / DSM 5692 / JCM 16813 / HR100) TaxID=485915 RepID=C8X0R2_DESRD|nr:PHP domain-containing protein [Desulfohalobium retbaense]ACV68009.1 PHP domain protein [Desulfohalobium retbaense DSM 5692]
MPCIDLHTHSNASDGTLTPRELIALARQEQVAAVALTDHDTTMGLPEAIEAGRELGVEVIPGCELSVDFPGGMMHVLGLWLPKHPRHLQKILQDLRNKRNTRNERMIAKLQAAGVGITSSEILKMAGDAAVGRPHIAQALVGKNIAVDFNDAFHRFIGPEGMAYVPKDKLSPKKAIAALREEEATVILAHPFSLGLSAEELEKEVAHLKSLGLDGIEAYYPEHSPELIRHCESLAERYDLLLSGGSDFHGAVKPDIHLGRGKDGLHVPYALLERMKKARRLKGQWVTESLL